ncbi:MAG: toll/interleukin-1 receptor domain-containing protein, partial [Candidatus Desulfatibia sp.]|uniref:toll/interleukin-1 receptor domain-containing protein n=1 Tax=Candidatus Desulfatibia sp. TaxID=3101189 RepID=UPI002F34C943
VKSINNCLEKLETDEFLAQLSGRIFLSYAREDVKKVESLYNNLRQAGFAPWMDTQDILPGELWEESINNAIRNSEFFIACISRSSLTKRGMLQKELKLAIDIWKQMLDKDIYLIPVRLEPCECPESLAKFQWVNIYEDDGWQRLISALRKGLMLRKVC